VASSELRAVPSERFSLVTGAAGFIGGRLVERLVKDGRKVRVFARRVNSTLERLRDSIDIAVGDIRDTSAVRDACRNVEVIHHLAALAKPWAKDPTEFFDINVTGTYNVCHAAVDLGVRRLVHMSTALVCPPTGKRAATDVTRITPYQRSKVEAEAIVGSFVKNGGDAVVVRPTRVFGPGLPTAGNTVTRLIDLYRRGRFRLRIADGNARANYVLVDDVVDGILRAEKRGMSGEAYVLGGTDCTLLEFLYAIQRAGAKPRRVFAVPQPLAHSVALAFELGGRLGFEPEISRDWVRLLSVDWPVSSAKAETELGYEPTPLSEAVRLTLDWLRGESDTTTSSARSGGAAA